MIVTSRNLIIVIQNQAFLPIVYTLPKQKTVPVELRFPAGTVDKMVDDVD
jgi:hypothetical protein